MSLKQDTVVNQFSGEKSIKFLWEWMLLDMFPENNKRDVMGCLFNYSLQHNMTYNETLEIISDKLKSNYLNKYQGVIKKVTKAQYEKISQIMKKMENQGYTYPSIEHSDLEYAPKGTLFFGNSQYFIPIDTSNFYTIASGNYFIYKSKVDIFTSRKNWSDILFTFTIENNQRKELNLFHHCTQIQRKLFVDPYYRFGGIGNKIQKPGPDFPLRGLEVKNGNIKSTYLIKKSNKGYTVDVKIEIEKYQEYICETEIRYHIKDMENFLTFTP